MAEGQNNNQAAGSAGNAAAGQKQEPTAPTGDVKSGGDGFDMKTEFEKAFKGLSDRFRQSVDDVGKKIADLEKKQGDTIEQTVAKLLAAEKQKQSGKRQDDGKPDPELEMASLKKQIEDLRKQAADAELAAQTAQREKRDAAIRSGLQAALGKADCLRSDVLSDYPRVLNQLDLDPQTGEIFAKVRDKYGNEEKVPLEIFVGDYLKKSYSEFFRGANRGGSPAAGDTGTGSSTPFEKLVEGGDASNFVANRAKIMQEIAAGKVSVGSKR